MSANYVLTDIIDRNAFDPKTRDSIAFRMLDRTLTFMQLQNSYRRIGAHLQRAGVRKGDHVAIYMGNRLEWLEVYFAIASIGAISVPINVMMKGRDVEAILTASPMDLLVADDESLSEIQGIAGIPSQLLFVGADAPALPGTAVMNLRDFDSPCELLETVTVTPDDPAMMYFTSGTTGTPKAAQHTHGGILWNTLHQVADLDLTPDEKFLVVPSLSWGAGLHHLTLAMTWIAAENTLLATGKRAVDRIVDEIERVGITRGLLVPTVLKEILRREDLSERIARSTFRRAMSGAEPLYSETTRALSQVLPNVAITQAYGMTEFPLFVTITTTDDATDRPGTAGRPSSIVTLGVVDESGDVVPRGAGEIAFRSPATTLGYHNAPEKNAESFRDGWFHTGDLGVIDDDGYLTIVGRSKDMIITGGLNIYPREIESVLSTIPGVIEAAVIGRKDDRWGEIPVAVVVVPEGSAVDREAVLAHCQKEISTIKRPKDVIIRHDPLPKTVTGKIVKRKITDPVPA